MELAKQPLNVIAADSNAAVSVVLSKRVKKVHNGTLPIAQISEDHEYVPTVGRWGNEWPS